MAIRNYLDRNPISDGQIARTGLAYLTCATIPGPVTLGKIATGHEVYAMSISVSKATIPGYHGKLLASGQVRLSGFEVIMDDHHTEQFMLKGFAGTVLDDITITVVQNHGEGKLAEPAFDFKMTNPRVTEIEANYSFDLTGASGIGPFDQSFHNQQIHSLNPNIISDIQDPSRRNALTRALRVCFVADKYEFGYFPANYDGSADGRIGTSFDVRKNVVA